MDGNLQWHNDARGAKAVEALQKNGFSALYFPKREEAVGHTLTLIPDKASVGMGGSVTTRSLALKEKLAQKGCLILDHQQEGLSPEQRQETRRKQLTADVFMCSSNAITLKGELYNVDGTGNTAAAMIFGPGKVIGLAGANKIVKDFAAAQARVKGLAAPLNNKRLNIGNPCTQTGECANCSNPSRICNVHTLISKRQSFTEFHVLIIGEELGY